jgi:hypothetical protein
MLPFGADRREHLCVGEERRHELDGEVRTVILVGPSRPCLMVELDPRLHMKFIVDDNEPPRPADPFDHRVDRGVVEAEALGPLPFQELLQRGVRGEPRVGR